LDVILTYLMDRYIATWVHGKSRRERQRRISVFTRFHEWLQATYRTEPKTLLAEAKRADAGPGKIDRILREYSNFLVTEKKTARTSSGQWFSLLRRYFTVNGVSLAGHPHKGYIKPDYEKDVLPTQESVSKMVQASESVRDKFVIAFLAQTGQRLAILTAIKRGMITEVGSRHGIVKVPETFPNPQGQNVNELGLPYTFVIGRDTMRLLRDLPRYDGGWLLDLSVRQIARIVDGAAQAVRIQEKKRTGVGRSWSTVHPNTFRKYWKDRMIEAGSDQRAVLYMLGQRIPRVLGSCGWTDDELLEVYKKAESTLEVA
jgi:integrase